MIELRKRTMQIEPANIVEFRDVSYEIDGTRILNDLNFEVSKGEILILLGESGCGKTTTLKLINRLIEPSSGQMAESRAISTSG